MSCCCWNRWIVVPLTVSSPSSQFIIYASPVSAQITQQRTHRRLSVFYFFFHKSVGDSSRVSLIRFLATLCVCLCIGCSPVRGLLKMVGSALFSFPSPLVFFVLSLRHTVAQFCCRRFFCFFVFPPRCRSVRVVELVVLLVLIGTHFVPLLLYFFVLVSSLDREMGAGFVRGLLVWRGMRDVAGRHKLGTWATGNSIFSICLHFYRI